MSTPEFVASSSRQTSQQSSQAFNEASGPSKSKRKNVSKDKVDAISKRSKNSGKEIVVAPSIATVDKDEVEDGIESEDEDTVFAPRMISEEKTRLQIKKLQQQPIVKMQNDEGQNMDLYIPRNFATNRLITSKDHASVQLNVDHLDEFGQYIGQFTTYALCGFIRAHLKLAFYSLLYV
ncbi:hypothetical protein H5410_028849 [Solanum commersonii]|uniref:Uncharacterized protein n=1 Tax=Solanum commersonii TaxID=4109 RepID=A0A9J5Z562_SOLCO|nr:hypothetical protein H5410_028849 [Solanum commersonii]